MEVRKLAERSQFAAKEISGLATSSVIRAENAGKLIQEIVPGHSKGFRLVQEIATVCNEQAQSAKQIEQTIVELEKITQSNSASSEQSASASEELTAQAQSLQEDGGLGLRLKIILPKGWLIKMNLDNSSKAIVL